MALAEGLDLGVGGGRVCEYLEYHRGHAREWFCQAFASRPWLDWGALNHEHVSEGENGKGNRACADLHLRIGRARSCKALACSGRADPNPHTYCMG